MPKQLHQATLHQFGRECNEAAKTYCIKGKTRITKARALCDSLMTGTVLACSGCVREFADSVFSSLFDEGIPEFFPDWLAQSIQNRSFSALLNSGQTGATSKKNPGKAGFFSV
jgi:hypothetical protein